MEAVRNGKLSFTHDEDKKKWGDMIDCGAFMAGFSEKFTDLMRANGIVNFDAYPLKIVTASKDCPTYYCLDVDCQKIPTYDELESEDQPDVMVLDTIELDFFLRSDWGKEDLFAIYTVSIHCTDRVKGLIEKAKLKNVRFEEVKPLEEVDLA